MGSELSGMRRQRHIHPEEITKPDLLTKILLALIVAMALVAVIIGIVAAGRTQLLINPHITL